MTEPQPGSPGELTFTAEEYAEFFGDTAGPLPPKSGRLPLWARLMGLFVAGAMALGGVLALVDSVRSNPDIREPLDIEAAAWEEVNASPFGWLVEDIVIVPILEPRVGAFVTNNPPDGIISVDDRPWTEGGVDELMDHEIGHLLDFALWEPRDPDRQGGLGTEPWAECAAVDAGTRRTDPRDPGGEYHCFEDELEIYRMTLGKFSEVCKRWGDLECRPIDR